jgi:hypothetical protein
MIGVSDQNNLFIGEKTCYGVYNDTFLNGGVISLVLDLNSTVPYTRSVRVYIDGELKCEETYPIYYIPGTSSLVSFQTLGGEIEYFAAHNRVPSEEYMYSIRLRANVTNATSVNTEICFDVEVPGECCNGTSSGTVVASSWWTVGGPIFLALFIVTLLILIVILLIYLFSRYGGIEGMGMGVGTTRRMGKGQEKFEILM